jgi:hypothetical protein
VAVIEIPCNSDFGTSNKIGTEEGVWSIVLIFCARNGRHAVSSWEKKNYWQGAGGSKHQEFRRVILVPSS